MRRRAAAPDTTERVVGRVLRPHGVDGEVSVEVHTDRPQQRFAPGSVLGHGAGRELVVAAMREHHHRLLVRFQGYPSRVDAELLRDAVLTVPVDPLEAEAEAEGEGEGEPDEFHDHQLEGLTAVGGDGTVLGVVRGVAHAPGHDLLVLDTGRDERLVPFVRDIVPEVDLRAQRVVLDPPAGLLDG